MTNTVPPPSVPVVDEGTGLVSVPWYNFFRSLPIPQKGQWTPTISGSTAMTVTYASSLTFGLYERVGDLVHVSLRIQVSGVSSAAGTVAIGLPFPASTESGNSNSWCFPAILSNTSYGTATEFVVSPNAGTTTAAITLSQSGAASVTLNCTQLTTASLISGSGWYQTT